MLEGGGGGDGSGTSGLGCCGCSGSTEKIPETVSNGRPLLLPPRPSMGPFLPEETVNPEMAVDLNSKHSLLLFKKD